MAHRQERDGNVGGCTEARLSVRYQASQCVASAAYEGYQYVDNDGSCD